jgi:hypothetical protein
MEEAVLTIQNAGRRIGRCGFTEFHNEPTMYLKV